jgi:hypothetical protein
MAHILWCRFKSIPTVIGIANLVDITLATKDSTQRLIAAFNKNIHFKNEYFF